MSASDSVKLSYRKLTFNNYEDPSENRSGLVRDTAFSGLYARKLTPSDAYASGLDMAYKELTNKDYVWIRISVMVYCTDSVTNINAALVASFEHKGEAYKYKAESITAEKYHLKPRQWTKVFFDFLTPETRSTEDRLKVYAWLQNGSSLLIDDFKVEMWDPKR